MLRALLQYSPTSLVTKTLLYTFHAQPLSLKGYYDLLQGLVAWVSDKMRGSRSNFECYLRKDFIVRTWDGFLLYVRPRTTDPYVIHEEVYELENWFKPHAKGVVVDVGAYIGTYTVRAMRTADLVVAIEPLPVNYKALEVNIRSNDCKREADVILINKAIAETKGKTYIYLPVESKCIGTEIARLEGVHKQSFMRFNVEIDTLDNMLSSLGIERIDLMKIDIEGYVSKAFPGMIESLKKTKWLIVELWKRDLPVIHALKQLGFRLVDRHAANFLFENKRF
jgi:FkbM family methyltransferase